MKIRFLSFIMFCVLLSGLVFAACDNTGSPSDTSAEEDTTEAPVVHNYDEGTWTGKFTCNKLGIYTCTCLDCGEVGEVYKDVPEDLLPEVNSIDGAKIMFIGNSFIYYGYAVINGSQGSPDYGYFYQLAKENGEDVTVYDYVWGGKNLEYIYNNNLKSLPEKFFADFDYVFMSEAGENNSNIIADIQNIMDLFPESTKFLYLCHTYTYDKGHGNIISAIPKMQSMGISVVNWGKLAHDIWTGGAKVPGGSMKYNKSSFIVNKKDTHHPNMLSGYLTAQMAYCAITGKSAVGQPYDFCTRSTTNSKFNITSFISDYYNPGTTNFDQVFASESEMKGIQQLMDEYLVKFDALPKSHTKNGDHLYEKLEIYSSAGTSNMCGIELNECRYCKEKIATETFSTSSNCINNLYVSYKEFGSGGAAALDEYISLGKGIFTYAAEVGVSNAENRCSLYNGSRTAKSGSGFTFTVSDPGAKYDADGNTGGDYVAIMGVDYKQAVTLKGYGLFAMNDGALVSYDILGGKKNEDGSITWTVLASVSDLAAEGGLVKGVDNTIYMGKTTEAVAIDCIRIAVKEARGTVMISELEIYE